MSEWLLFNANSAIIQLYHVENKLIFNEMMAMRLNFYSASSLKQQSEMDMSLHSDTLFWFQANQSLLLLLNAACIVGKQKYQFYSPWFDPTRARTQDLLTQGEHANHYTTDAVKKLNEWSMFRSMVSFIIMHWLNFP